MIKKRNEFVFSLVLLSFCLSLGGCAGAKDSAVPAPNAIEESDNASELPPNITAPIKNPEPPSDDREAAREVIPVWEGKVPAGKDWTVFVNRQIDQLGVDFLNLAPSDRKVFCPKYDSLSDAQRVQFWTYLLSLMAEYESRFNTNAKLTESFYDAHGKRVVSRGLLQISIESGNGYGCKLKNAQELHDPLKNLSCGVRILSRLVKRDNRIAGRVFLSWRGGARYWAVLRSSLAPYKYIVRGSQRLSICK